MHRRACWLAALISLITLPAAALAESPANTATADMQMRILAPVPNAAGFYVTLPVVDSNQLIERISTQRAALAQREQEVRRYLEDHQLDARDMLITIIMPGGLLYAAAGKGNLEQAQVELTEISAVLDELSRDLVAMQAVAGDLSMAQLQ